MTEGSNEVGDGPAWAPRGAVLALVYGILFAVACIPIFAFEVIPLGDMPNHLARAYIIGNIDSDPLLQKYYAIDWRLFSFQSTDIFLPPLIRIFGLSLGHQLFVAAAFALLIGGTAAVHRAFFGFVGLWPAATFLFLFNFPLACGQVSFLFTTGLSLLLFAAWLRREHAPRLVRMPFFVVASFGLMVCHFFAFAAYALLLMALELGLARRTPGWRERVERLVEAGLPFVLPAVFFLLSFGKTISGAGFYGSIFAKAIAFLSATITYGSWPDVVVSVAVIAALWWLRRRLAFAAEMRLPALVLILAAVAMPRLLQGVLGADLRLPCLLAFLLVASSEVRFAGRRQAAVFAAGVLLLLSFRVGLITAQWAHADADYREFRAADDKLPPGARVAVLPIDRDLRAEPQPKLPYWFVTCLAVIDRHTFDPLLYTFATPLTLTAEGKALDGAELARGRVLHWRPADPGFATADAETVRQAEWVAQRMSDEDVYTSRIDWSHWPERFDYLVDVHLGRQGNPVPALLTEVWRGSFFSIYRIHPPGAAQ